MIYGIMNHCDICFKKNVKNYFLFFFGTQYDDVCRSVYFWVNVQRASDDQSHDFHYQRIGVKIRFTAISTENGYDWRTSCRNKILFCSGFYVPYRMHRTVSRESRTVTALYTVSTQLSTQYVEMIVSFYDLFVKYFLPFSENGINPQIKLYAMFLFDKWWIWSILSVLLSVFVVWCILL